MNASSRYREVKSFILNIYCNYSNHCIKMHTDYIHKYCILLKYRYVLEKRMRLSKRHKTIYMRRNPPEPIGSGGFL